MQAVGLGHPELVAFRQNFKAAPVVGTGNGFALPLAGKFIVKVLKGFPIGQRSGLSGNALADLAVSRAGVPVVFRNLSRGFLGGSGNMNLTPQMVPVKIHGHFWIDLEILTFFRVIIGKKHKTTFREFLQEHHTGCRLPTGISCGNGHGRSQGLFIVCLFAGLFEPGF